MDKLKYSIDTSGEPVKLDEQTNWVRYFASNTLWIVMFILPIINRYFITPLVFHPQRLGGVPWTPPNSILITLVETIIDYFFIIVIFIFSSTVYSLDFCGKRDITLSSKRTIWAVMGYLISKIISYPLSMLMTPITSIIPFGDELATQFIRSYIGMYFASMGFESVVEELCN